ncbi:NTP pyrophosphatase, house-cleaning of non-canonical NTPs [Clostridium acidisoli DSM 12555]|uniref:NTP pyrophosphatase, house-cleaning of non-canonical NTPs n=1 Tax=Clostridium acidisoli DSM 12555 TaxID=1121291 RepID=A0A1W1X0M4_9CLOT|nr:nucleotide pyrophosphohydrolase [Clostridium acidisoli]SMC17268.1 NTP pyrophosphatase, house-cleaning of non-canonical NTPs [Clostridium acidisoli DSM 12555]
MEKSLKEITNEIVEFSNIRDWDKFHNPKDLAISLSLEASELLECFQWKNSEEVGEMINSSEIVKIEDEIADVGNYLLLLCDKLNLNLFEAIDKKLLKNNKKYPIDKCKGKSTKYNKL